MLKSTPAADRVNHDFFSKFIRTWAAGFVAQIIVPTVVGYLLFLLALSPASRSWGLNMALAADMLFIPSAIFTAGAAWLCVTLANRLRTAVIASALLGLSIPVLIFAPAIIYSL